MIWAWILGSLTSQAAEGNELRSWNEVGIKADLPKHFELSLSEQLRVVPSQGVFADELLTDVALSYSDWKHLELSLGYRFGLLDVGSEDPGRTQRLHVDVDTDWKTGPVRLDARVRYQQRAPWTEERAKHTLRLKVGVRPRVKWDVVPYASLEPWKRFEDPGLQKLRGEVGLRYGKKDWGAKVFYRPEFPISDPTDPRVHIIGLNVSREVDWD